jgi:hypothetical protein
VEILADVLEIRDPRWANVIEGYLSRQKQYLLVAPDVFPAALAYYDRRRQDLPLFAVSLIDGEKVAAARPPVLPGSLAEIISTDNPSARAYIDFLLGQVIRCDRAEDLRRHERAVTDQGLLYQGYVISSINPELWRYHLIGQLAISSSWRGLKPNCRNWSVSLCPSVR